MKHWGKGKDGVKGNGVNFLEIKCYEWVGKKGDKRGFLIDDLVVGILDREGEGGRGIEGGEGGVVNLCGILVFEVVELVESMFSL